MSKKTNLKIVPAKESAQEIQQAPLRALSPFDEMERIFEHLMPRGWLRPLSWDRPLWSELGGRFEMKAPRIDVLDRDEDVVVRAEMPGVDKKDVEVSVNETTVTIRGKTSHEEKEEKGDYYRCEISRGAYTRTVALPARVDGAKAKAVFKEGMLELTLPKLEKSKRHAVSVD